MEANPGFEANFQEVYSLRHDISKAAGPSRPQSSRKVPTSVMSLERQLKWKL